MPLRWFQLHCHKNICFRFPKSAQHTCSRCMYRMPNRSSSIREKFPIHHHLLGMRAGVAELRIILWELIPQSWELATPPPSAPLIFKQFLCHGNSIFLGYVGDAISDLKFFSDGVTSDSLNFSTSLE